MTNVTARVLIRICREPARQAPELRLVPIHSGVDNRRRGLGVPAYHEKRRPHGYNGCIKWHALSRSYGSGLCVYVGHYQVSQCKLRTFPAVHPREPDNQLEKAHISIAWNVANQAPDDSYDSACWLLQNVACLSDREPAFVLREIRGFFHTAVYPSFVFFPSVQALSAVGALLLDNCCTSYGRKKSEQAGDFSHTRDKWSRKTASLLQAIDGPVFVSGNVQLPYALDHNPQIKTLGLSRSLHLSRVNQLGPECGGLERLASFAGGLETSPPVRMRPAIGSPRKLPHPSTWWDTGPLHSRNRLCGEAMVTHKQSGQQSQSVGLIPSRKQLQLIGEHDRRRHFLSCLYFARLVRTWGAVAGCHLAIPTENRVAFLWPTLSSQVNPDSTSSHCSTVFFSIAQDVLQSQKGQLGFTTARAFAPISRNHFLLQCTLPFFTKPIFVFLDVLDKARKPFLTPLNWPCLTPFFCNGRLALLAYAGQQVLSYWLKILGCCWFNFLTFRALPEARRIVKHSLRNLPLFLSLVIETARLTPTTEFSLAGILDVKRGQGKNLLTLRTGLFHALSVSQNGGLY